MAYSVSVDVFDRISQKVCTKQNSVRAHEYLLKTRKLDSTKFKAVPFLTSDLSSFCLAFNFKDDWLSDSLFFPIFDLTDTLIGFDIRYTGSLDYRTRYYKLKKPESSLFNYNCKALLSDSKYLFVCEGVLDLETLSLILDKSKLGFSFDLISPLTCLSNPNYISLLLSSFENIVFCYDNDSAGINSINKIKNFVKKEDLSKVFFLNYIGKDISDSYRFLGESKLYTAISKLQFDFSLNCYYK